MLWRVNKLTGVTKTQSPMDTSLELPPISIVIPAYNEEAGISITLEELLKEEHLQNAEIIVIDDGSTDCTREIAKNFNQVKLVTHLVNRGYGSAIVTGTRAATTNYIFWFDADGQHRVDDLLLVARTLIDENWEYCIGIRDERSHVDISRVPGKHILKLTAQIITGESIKDFNSGLRGFQREVLIRYLHLLPKRFGASTTTTLLMLEQKHFGGGVPIIVRKRIGHSSVKSLRDGIATLMIMLRLLLLFKPLYFWGTIGASMIIGGFLYGFIETFRRSLGFPVFGALIILLGVQSLFFGLLSDQISILRRERFD